MTAAVSAELARMQGLCAETTDPLVAPVPSLAWYCSGLVCAGTKHVLGQGLTPVAHSVCIVHPVQTWMAQCRTGQTSYLFTHIL